MPSVSPEVITHSLNVDPMRKLMVQKPHKASAQHVEAVNDEIKRLIDTRAIREVQYSTWLANPMVVEKKNWKWRVYINFTDLNDACSKDCFLSL